jgi:hypothetical protein
VSFNLVRMYMPQRIANTIDKPLGISNEHQRLFDIEM